MADEKTCPHCGEPIPPTAPGGICPECMLKAGIAAQTEGPPAAESAGRFIPPPIGEIAKLFPQLEILRLIGQGGMGAVYKARQPALDRFVALKVLPPTVGEEPGFAERFNREARALARLNHPNIVAVHDFGKAGPLHYLLMEFVDGANLREVERAGQLTPEQALAVVPQICAALQFAHDEGIVHRDIKPENLLLDKKGRIKITDFGIAKMLGAGAGQQNLTGAKDVVGTPHYMAPEQVEKPLSVDHRADIYSLGVVFYEMLTGELPLGKFQPPSRKVQIDVRLDDVVLHALEKEPERRYQHASEVKTDVETIAVTGHGAVPSNQNEPTAAQIEAARRRLKIPARGLIAAAVLQVLFGLGLLAIALPAVIGEGGGWAGCAAVSFGAGLFMVFGLVVLLGAVSMMRLRNFPFSVAASVVGAIAGPGAILGLPFGVWACVELFRPEVRSAFAISRFPIPPVAAPDAGKMNLARAQIKGPAIGLVVTGVFDWVLMTAVCIGIAFKSPTSMFVWLPLLAMALSGCIIYAGLKLIQLERRGWVTFGGVLAILVSPGNLIGLPIGIWALVVLNRREVREVFEANRHDGNLTRCWSARFGAAWKFAAFIFVLLLSYELSRTIFSHLIADRFYPVKSDYIGQAWFPQGDSIEITSVARTPERMAVKGHYNLVSHDQALLALYVTTESNSNGRESAPPESQSRLTPTATDRSGMQITKGSGNFELIDTHLASGLPHVSMYANGHSFALLYFGTKTEALEEGKADWITNISPASAEMSNDDVQTLVEQPPVVVETFPVSGTRDVAPGETEIRVRFSKPMADGSWGWSTAWENSTPESVGPPHYLADQCTCVMRVRLEPGRTYAWWLNSDKFKNCTDRAGRPAVPYLLIFQTRQN